MMRWVRPDIYKKNKNASTAIHVKAMHCVMKFCVSSSDRGWKFPLEDLRQQADSDYATCPNTRKSLRGYATDPKYYLLGLISELLRYSYLSSSV
jgi:hypothetical protein